MNSRGIRRFNRESPEAQKLYTDAAKKRIAGERLNKETHDYLRKNGFGPETWRNPNDPVFLAGMIEGQKYAEKLAKEPWYNEPVKQWILSSREYQKAAGKFLNSLDLDSLKVPSKGVTDLVYEIDSKTMRQATIQEILEVEMLRRAGGKIGI